MRRRDFIGLAGAFAAGGCVTVGGRDQTYSVAVLGDTHFDAEPESVYHSHYDESNKWAKVQHEEFRRNGEMWRGRCRDLLGASGRLAAKLPTDFVLQLGDLVQGDCDDAPTHRKMLTDCMSLLRGAYPANLPFLTVMGNHDFRGKDAREAYLAFARDHFAKELACTASYPAFSFRRGPDLWVFCDFETRNLAAICAEIERAPDARYVFLVTHGPFTISEDGFYRWRLGGAKECEAGRRRLYELLSRRHAIVLSGHTHTVRYVRVKNSFGGYGEFTCNTVWSKPELATAEPVYSKVEDFGRSGFETLTGDKLAEYRREVAFFSGDIADYAFYRAAGHFRLDVDDAGVRLHFYPGATLEAAKTFSLR